MAPAGSSTKTFMEKCGLWGTQREKLTSSQIAALAWITPSPFMRSYYQRVAERYLSPQGELRGTGPNGDCRALSRPMTW